MRITPLLLIGLLAAACARHQRAPTAHTARVLVYNIHAGKDAQGRPSLEGVADVVRRARADLVLLQEVDRLTERSGRVDQVATLERLTGLRGVFGRTLDFQGGLYGIAILSRWPVVRDTLVDLPVEPAQTRAGGSTEPRGALYVTLARAPGDTLRVINTHIDASREDTYRRQEAAHLLALVARVRPLGGRVLLGGDLNSTPESVVHTMFDTSAVRDAWPQCADTAGVGLTYPVEQPIKRIDYLLIPADVRCLRAEVLPATASDHRPVLFTIAY